MADNSFFDEQTEQSLVKATIVARYFPAYMGVISNAQKKYGGNRIAYIDLFSGPGRYKNGSASTPVKIVTDAIKNPEFRKRLVTIFNDKDDDNVRSLETELKALPGYGTLKYPPKVYHGEVGDDIVKRFEKMTLVPTLFFVDPWGYKGMTLRLINSVLKDWGCDCVFFFNYSRVNMGLVNDAVEKHMDALFGKKHADAVRAKFADKSLKPDERESFIVEEMSLALKEMGGTYVLPFRFHSRTGARVTHHLFFVSKHFRGYELMRRIMREHSTGKFDGVVNFEYNPADHRQPTIFSLLSTVDQLEGMLSEGFDGKTISVQKLYETHSVGRPFLLEEYKEVLMKMHEAGKIQASRDDGKKIRKNSFPEDIVVTFKPVPIAAGKLF